ncbi:MAG: sugar phosphate isomerase/epimerase family protein [Candidatus Onthomonas sp.]
MKISTEIASAARHIGEERAIEYYAKAGFDAWDFSMFSMCQYDWNTQRVSKSSHPLAGEHYLTFARRLKQVGLDNGIVCNQSHAPFPSALPEIRSYFKRAIECTAEAGGKICVIHPENDKTPEENAELYFELLPFAKECGVKIAAENMWNWDRKKDEAFFAACGTPESFRAHLEAVNDDAFVACLDIGHAEMRGCNTSAVEMIRTLGGKLQALHLHDNDRRHDLHQIPFSMEIDFPGIVRALKEIGYSGYFTLEADQFLKDYTEEDIFQGIRQLAGAARRLAMLYEQL